MSRKICELLPATVLIIVHFQVTYGMNFRPLDGTSREKHIFSSSEHAELDNRGGMSINTEEYVDNQNTWSSRNPKGRPFLMQNLFVPVVPDKCKNSLTFCTLTENYPSNYVDSIVRSKSKWINVIDEIDEEIGNRFGEDTADISLCISKECVVYPKTAQNKEDNWVFIVNTDRYKQGVRVELCLNESDECDHTASFPPRVRSMCKQKYIYRTLVAVDNSGKEFKDKFKMPSCCSCVLITSNEELADDFNPKTQSRAVLRTSKSDHINAEKCNF